MLGLLLGGFQLLLGLLSRGFQLLLGLLLGLLKLFLGLVAGDLRLGLACGRLLLRGLCLLGSCHGGSGALLCGLGGFLGGLGLVLGRLFHFLRLTSLGERLLFIHLAALHRGLGCCALLLGALGDVLRDPHFLPGDASVAHGAVHLTDQAFDLGMPGVQLRLSRIQRILQRVPGFLDGRGLLAERLGLGERLLRLLQLLARLLGGPGLLLLGGLGLGAGQACFFLCGSRGLRGLFLLLALRLGVLARFGGERLLAGGLFLGLSGRDESGFQARPCVFGRSECVLRRLASLVLGDSGLG